MTSLSLYDKTTSFGSVYTVFIMNRIQVLYFFLIMPSFLVHPYMIWGIIAIGLFTQINLFILSKWFHSRYAGGYQGFVDLLGDKPVRILAFLSLGLLFIKIAVLTLGIGEIVYQYIFPSMNSNWFVLFIFLICYYIASQGMEKTIQLVVIVFFSTFWILFVFISFFFPPTAAIHDLYPLYPIEWTRDSWRGILFIGSAFSGPEFLVFLAPWLKPKQTILKSFTIANMISTMEYLLLFLASLFFFGPAYLNQIEFPVIDMIRYLQSPFFERIEIILISIHLFVLIFGLSIFLLYFYGAARVVVGTAAKKTTRLGFLISWLMIVSGVIIVNEWFWKSGDKQILLLNLQIWFGAFTYLLVPVSLLAVMKWKERLS